MSNDFKLGCVVEVLSKPNPGGVGSTIGKVIGPLGVDGKYPVEYFPGVGCGHHAPLELRILDQLPKNVSWNHQFWL